MSVRYALTRLRLYRPITQINEKGHYRIGGGDTYCLPTTGSYNSSSRPADVTVRDRSANPIRHRETLEDLTRCDVL